MEVSIGTPRIPFGLYVDTGSSDLVVTYVPCLRAPPHVRVPLHTHLCTCPLTRWHALVRVVPAPQ